MTSRKLADRILAILDDLQALDPVCMDVRGFSSLADYYMVAGANSKPHLKEMGAEIRVRLKREGVRDHVAETDAESGWILLDYLDVVLHIMLDETRRYYALEELWSDTNPLLPEDRVNPHYS